LSDSDVTQPSPASTYSGRRAVRAAALERLERRHAALAMARLAVAVLAAVVLWGALGPRYWSLGLLAVPALAFLTLAVVHDRVIQARDHAARSVEFYDRGLARIEDRWSGLGPTGTPHSPQDHPYADDLDLFGEGSLFQLISGARLRAGEETLAHWLLSPTPAAAIRERQAAVRALTPRLDVREQLALTGGDVAAFLDTTTLVAWGQQPTLLTESWPRVAAAGLAAANVAAIAAGFWLDASSAWLALAVTASTAYALLWRRRVSAVLASVNAPARQLRLLAEVLALVEAEPSSSLQIERLHQRLAATGATASHRIRALTRLADLLESRQNQIFAPIALLVLWGTQLAWAIEAWRAQSGRALAEWVAVAGEFEALSSLAGYAFEHPADPFPEIVETGPLVDAVALAHPLIPASRVVANDVRLDENVRVLVVSGSNMSGKSTMLRTVGINVVLALAGAPVRAARLAVSPLAIGATLRVQDSLQAGRSRFFAEISRLKQIVDLASGPLPVLFLLDELLSGTNSHDRRIGAAGIVEGLVAKGAIGMVTTHDLALADVVSDLGVHARNVHFSDVFEEGTLNFDYRMRDGVVRTSNALALMQSIGLAVNHEGSEAQRRSEDQT
jgi:hypothetical protein